VGDALRATLPISLASHPSRTRDGIEDSQMSRSPDAESDDYGSNTTEQQEDSGLGIPGVELIGVYAVQVIKLLRESGFKSDLSEYDTPNDLDYSTM
jgi:hypothetical protein